MRAVLGLDTAWTATGTSGVALVAEADPGSWRVVSIHASYADFIEGAGVGCPKEFGKIPGALVEASRVLAPGATLSTIVADMPLSKLPIIGRRSADDLISKRFGAAKCGTHSPSAIRPGPISAMLRDGFAQAGFPLATDRIFAPGLYETYPHPVLLHLMQVAERYPYKVSRARKLWPEHSPADRWQKAVDSFRAIAVRLDRDISGANFIWPTSAVPLSSLKPIEDKLDALICAWVGTLILADAARCFGDADAAVWLPA